MSASSTTPPTLGLGTSLSSSSSPSPPSPSISPSSLSLAWASISNNHTSNTSYSTNTAPLHRPQSLAESVGYQGYLHADPIVQPRPNSNSSSTSSSDELSSSPPSGSYDALVPYSESSSPSLQPSRQYARTALKMVGHRAQTLAQSSKVVQFGVNTTAAVARTIIPNAARQFTLHQWENYGEPLLNKIDQRIDEAFYVVEQSRAALGSTISSSSSDSSISPSSSLSNSSPLFNSNSLSSSSAAAHHHLRHDIEEMKDYHEPLDHEHSSPSSSTLVSHTDVQDDRLTLDAHDDAMYALYWQKLKGKFVESRWYSMVDAILLQNRVVEAFSARMMRPAENFYNTVTEEFLTHGTMEEFMAALKVRVGPAWDERLSPLAKAFYSTAKAVSSVVGAGRFVGGALQLGRAKVHTVIDQLIHRWEQVLGTGDDYADKWLHDADQPPLLTESDHGVQHSSFTSLISLHDLRTNGYSYADAVNNSTLNPSSSTYSASLPLGVSSSSSSLSSSAPISNPPFRTSVKRSGADIDEIDPGAVVDKQTDEEHEMTNGNISGVSSSNDVTSLASSRHNSSNHLSALANGDATSCYPPSSSTPSSVGLATKVSKRLRQRIPSIVVLSPTLVTGWSDRVRTSLSDRGDWFSGVDEILLQNSFVQALASFMQPAEHFYNTSIQLFQTRVLKRQAAEAAAAQAAAAQQLAKLANGGDGTMMEADGDAMDDSEDNASVISNASTASTATHASNGHMNGDGIANSPSPPPIVIPSSVPLSPQSQVSSSSSVTVAGSDTLPSDSPIVVDFVQSLKVALGASWDERLKPHARSFFNTAWAAVKQVQREEQAQAAS